MMCICTFKKSISFLSQKKRSNLYPLVVFPNFNADVIKGLQEYLTKENTTHVSVSKPIYNSLRTENESM